MDSNDPVITKMSRRMGAGLPLDPGLEQGQEQGMESVCFSSATAPLVARSFARAASGYAAHATAQDRVAARVDEALARAPEPVRVWEIGCGTGLLTARLRARWPRVRLLAQDISQGMLLEAAGRLAGAGVEWRLGDAATDRPAEPVDMVVSSSSLHWLGSPASVLRALWPCLAPGGTLVAGLMLAGTLAELRATRRTIRPTTEPETELPAFGDWIGALPPDARVLLARTWEEIDWFPSAREALRSIRAQGVNAPPFQPARRLGVAEARALASRWEEGFASPDRGVPCTYHAGLLVVRRELR
jgi:malonyl-CoA O-methyltransferase